MPHRLIGWLTRLPQDWELRFDEELTKLQGTKTAMMTTDSIPAFIEIRAMERARRQDILDVLEARFGAVSDEVRARIEALAEEGSCDSNEQGSGSTLLTSSERRAPTSRRPVSHPRLTPNGEDLAGG